jgi:hypothetical protein
MGLLYGLVLMIAGIAAATASVISFWLIMRHQQNMTNMSVQSKIVGIIWMIPIYSIDSFLGLSIPQVADYVNMLRDCYEVRPPTSTSFSTAMHNLSDSSQRYIRRMYYIFSCRSCYRTWAARTRSASIS